MNVHKNTRLIYHSRVFIVKRWEAGETLDRVGERKPLGLHHKIENKSISCEASRSPRDAPATCDVQARDRDALLTESPRKDRR